MSLMPSERIRYSVTHFLFRQFVLTFMVLSLFSLSGAQTYASELNNIYLSTSRSVAGDYLAGRYARRNSMPDEAIKYYSKALSSDPYNADLLNHMYELLVFNGEMENAFHLARRHTDMTPNAPKANFLQAVRYMKQDDFAGAARRLNKLYDPKDPDSAKDTLSAIAVPLTLAWADAMQGKYDEASEIIGRVLYPSVEQLVSDQRGVFETLSKNERLEHLPLYYLAEMMLEIGKREWAIDNFNAAAFYFRMAQYLSPDLEQTYLLLGDIMEKVGQFNDAIALYQHIPSTSSFYRKAQTRVAVSHYKLEQLDESRLQLMGLAESDAKDYESLLTLADMFMDLDKYEEAIETYSKALERIGDVEKEHWSILYARGIAYEQLKQWEKAEPDFLKALELYPDQPEVLNYLGYSWLIMDKNLEEAKDMLQKAVIQRPTNSYIIDSYGWALYKLGLYEEAVAFLERANALIPDNITTNEHLGDVYWQTGRFREARFQWERALKLDPNPEEKAALEEKLRKGLHPASAQNVTSE